MEKLEEMKIDREERISKKDLVIGSLVGISTCVLLAGPCALEAYFHFHPEKYEACLNFLDSATDTLNLFNYIF